MSALPPLPRSAVTRFWVSVDKITASPCWVWVGSKTSKHASRAYGQFSFRDRRYLAHRISFTLARGPIPKELTLDHLCRRPACVNPAHLEAVTHRENVIRGIGPSARAARSTHCIRGHAYDCLAYDGSRRCSTCINAQRRRAAPRPRRTLANCKMFVAFRKAYGLAPRDAEKKEK